MRCRRSLDRQAEPERDTARSPAGHGGCLSHREFVAWREVARPPRGLSLDELRDGWGCGSSGRSTGYLRYPESKRLIEGTRARLDARRPSSPDPAQGWERRSSRSHRTVSFYNRGHTGTTPAILLQTLDAFKTTATQTVQYRQSGTAEKDDPRHDTFVRRGSFLHQFDSVLCGSRRTMPASPRTQYGAHSDASLPMVKEGARPPRAPPSIWSGFIPPNGMERGRRSHRALPRYRPSPEPERRVARLRPVPILPPRLPRAAPAVLASGL
jgi:hypothetical protein